VAFQIPAESQFSYVQFRLNYLSDSVVNIYLHTSAKNSASNHELESVSNQQVALDNNCISADEVHASKKSRSIINDIATKIGSLLVIASALIFMIVGITLLVLVWHGQKHWKS